MFYLIPAFIFIITIRKIDCFIYQLNDTEYARMPPMYHMDPYESCMEDPEGFYCTAELTLVSDTLTPLLVMIQEYSEYTVKHFNHSKLRYGVCMSKSCRKHWNGSKVDPRHSLVACLNEIIFKNYSLNVNVNESPLCHKNDQPVIFNTADTFVAFVCLMILSVNLVASIFDMFIEQKSQARDLIKCFSIQRNLQRLVTSSNYGRDNRYERLSCLNGFKSLTTIIIIGIHSIIPLMVNIANPYFFERSDNNLFFHILYNGTIVTQLFLITSGLMLAYNMQTNAEKITIKWSFITKAVAFRWLRLTPAYAFVLALTSTLVRYAGQGPLWQYYVNVEADSCSREWIWNMLYMHSYLKNGRCMTQTWYLEAEMMLSILGIVFWVIFRKKPYRNIALGILFIIGVVTPALQTYFQNLDGAMLSTPENLRSFFRWCPTFYSVYKTVHNNLACYVLGLALGYYIYQKQTDNIDIRLKNIRFIIWSMFPIIINYIMFTSIPYADKPGGSLYTRTLYAGLSKPVYGLFIVVLIVGMVFKCEDSHRKVFEWPGWIVPAKLSYNALLLHVTVIKMHFGVQTTVMVASYHTMAGIFLSCVMLSFIVAIPLHLMVEAPIAQLARLCLHTKNELKSTTKHNSVTSDNGCQPTIHKIKNKIF